jgi:hypothetical protein
MFIAGEIPHFPSRGGDARGINAHNGNLTTLHTVRNFRSMDP